MGIISQVGRKDPKVRLIIAAIYLSLAVGAVSILLPFIIMLTLSVGSVTDVKEISLYPRYLTDDSLLFVKYLAEKNSEDINKAKEAYPVEGQNWINWNQVRPVLSNWTADQALKARHLKADWDAFLTGLPPRFYSPGYLTNFSNGPAQYSFQKFLGRRYTDVQDFNARNGMNLAYLSTVNFPDDNYSQKMWFPEGNQFQADYADFKMLMPSEMRRVSALNPIYALFLKYRYNDKVEELNHAWGTHYKDLYFNDVVFPLAEPAQAAQRKDRADFLHERFSLNWIKIQGVSPAAYQTFLKKRFPNVGEFNTVAGTTYAAWSAVELPVEAPQRPEIRYWGEFVNTLPLSSWTLDFPELRWRDYMMTKYGSLDKAAGEYGVDLRVEDGIMLPVKQANESAFKQSRFKLKAHFLTYNYRMVIRFLLLQNRAFMNTLLLVFLSIFTALTINPIAAYALSRFRYRYTQRILLVLLATAAVPAEVAAIPQFLLIKKLGMLNTFWALVLPGIANGFWIFMLKGFFDSLPKELYEAAILDGAGEFTLFVRVTAPLAAPILALTAFSAFTGAYGSYLWNIIVANNSNMWTIMVFLQQYMGSNPNNMVMAAIVVSSIPTLLAFLLVQRAILKGIVIPTLH